jgi:hypothetical protein
MTTTGVLLGIVGILIGWSAGFLTGGMHEKRRSKFERRVMTNGVANPDTHTGDDSRPRT